MAEGKDNRAQLAELTSARWERIRKLRPELAGVQPASGPEGSRVSDAPAYFYRRDTLLAAREATGPVSEALKRQGIEFEPEQGDERSGVLGFRLRMPGADTVDVPRVLAEVRAELGPDRAQLVSPDHLFFPAPWNTLGPGGEPELPPGRTFTAADPSAGRGVKVSIIDTGLLERPRPPQLQHDLILGANAIENQDYDGNGYIDPVAGHGTFIAGIIRQIAPGVELEIEQMIDQAGLISERDLADRLHAALDRGPQIINLSLGGYTDLQQEPLALRSVWERVETQDPPVVVVAAAGNCGSDEPFYPAATALALGVGALGVDGQRAWFSNYGDWVDVWAPGEDLQSVYAIGDYLMQHPPQWQSWLGPLRSPLERIGGGIGRLVRPVRHFKGIARWSGTSFATPVVVGTIAALMSQQHITAPEARKLVAAKALNVIDLARP
jgi:subtilisin family serine protease